MWIPISIKLLSFLFTEMASSKSFASSGSIVMVVVFLRSFLFFISLSHCNFSNLVASLFNSSENSYGSSYSSKIAWISFSTIPFSPIILITFPSGNSCSHLLNSITTISFSFAFSLLLTIKETFSFCEETSTCILLSFKTTDPTKFIFFLSIIFKILPLY